MSNGLLVAVFAVALMLGSAALLFSLGRRQEEREKIAHRLDEAVRPKRASAEKRYPLPLRWVYQVLQRSGLVRRPGHLLILTVLSILVSAVALLIKGVLGLLAALGLFSLCVYLFILWRTAHTRQILLQQLPGFIDQIIRTMGVGRSFESALLLAIENSAPPLSETLEGVKIESALGGDIVEALRETAQVYRMKELYLLTLALRINQRYGGSIRAMLESIIALIRQREQAGRELRALTGETRLSAWVLGTLPLALAGYLMIMNPAYIGFLLEDPDGMNILYLAVGLQASGVLILWRMMRSIQ